VSSPNTLASPSFLTDSDTRGPPEAEIAELVSPSMGPAYFPLIPSGSDLPAPTVCGDAQSVEVVRLPSQLSPVTTDDSSDLEENLLTFYSEKLTWNRHPRLAKENFHIMWSGGAGPRNWGLNELLIFLNELLPDWLKENSSRHYANTDGRSRN
jgi:hypothetical protein